MLDALREILTCAARVFGMLPGKERCLLGLAVALMAVAGALAAVPALVVGMLVDDMLAEVYASFAAVVPYFLIMIAAVVIKELLTVCRKWITEDTCTHLQQRQTVGLVSHLLRIDLAFFTRQRTGSLNGRVHRSVEGLIRLLKLAFLDFFPAAFAATCAILIALTKQLAIGGIMIVGVFVGVAIILWQVSSQRGIRIGLLRDREAMDGAVVETLGGIESVRASDTGDLEAARVDAVAQRLRRREIRHHIQMAWFDAAKFLSESSFHVLVLGASAWMAISGSISIGEVLVFSLLYVNVAAPLRELHRIFDEAHESALHVLDLFDLTEYPEDLSFSTLELRVNTKGQEAPVPFVEFRDASFTYPGANTSEPAIKGIDLTVQRSERVGIVGKTGSGKSTLAKLLLRLYQHKRGGIYIDGVPILDVSREAIARRVGYVSQNPYVFTGSVYENIAYNTPGATLEDAKAAAVSAHIHDEIVGNLGGYNGRISERGSNLSGGQRQRIVLARLFLQNPELLILDEATAALDNVTEAAVQAALDDLGKGRTMLVIAHRLNTVRNTDRILVMDNGRIAESGTYEELMERNGQFASLCCVA